MRRKIESTRQRIPEPRATRITSYNVCYTKLLRNSFMLLTTKSTDDAAGLDSRNPERSGSFATACIVIFLLSPSIGFPGCFLEMGAGIDIVPGKADLV